MATTALCPLFTIGGEHAPCQREGCSLWMKQDGREDCALRMAVSRLADCHTMLERIGDNTGS